MMIVTAVEIAAARASAGGKIRRVPAAVTSIKHVGAYDRQIPRRAFLEVAGGLALLIAFSLRWLGRVAAAGLALYFLGAVIAYLRVKDGVKEYAPAVFLLLFFALIFVWQGQQ